MNKKIYLLSTLILGLCMTSCHTQAPLINYKALAKASVKLGIDIGLNDNHTLFLESASWIGTPYRRGGSSKQGTDCSGMVYSIYQKVYKLKVERNTEMLKKNCKKINKNNLREGDLVFFSSNRSPRKVTHTGIYLKNGKFIHASSSQGVIVSKLSESYYTKHWMGGGRILQ